MRDSLLLPHPSLIPSLLHLLHILTLPFPTPPSLTPHPSLFHLLHILTLPFPTPPSLTPHPLPPPPSPISSLSLPPSLPPSPSLPRQCAAVSGQLREGGESWVIKSTPLCPAVKRDLLFHAATQDRHTCC